MSIPPDIHFCFECGAKNRIPLDRERDAICGKCKEKIYPDLASITKSAFPIRNERVGSVARRRKWLVPAALAAAALAMYAALSQQDNPGNQREDSAQRRLESDTFGKADGKEARAYSLDDIYGKQEEPAPRSGNSNDGKWWEGDPLASGATAPIPKPRPTASESTTSGLFDDLIPKKAVTDTQSGAPAPRGNVFDQFDNASPGPALAPVSIKPGIVWDNLRHSRVAPLKIVTKPGSNYYVKLIQQRTGQDVIGIYVRGGEPIEVLVPLGTYKLRYATGSVWYGPEHYFGADTQYNESYDLFEFSNMGTYYSGYTIELIRQFGGNMETRRINASNF